MLSDLDQATTGVATGKLQSDPSVTSTGEHALD